MPPSAVASMVQFRGSIGACAEAEMERLLQYRCRPGQRVIGDGTVNLVDIIGRIRVQRRDDLLADLVEDRASRQRSVPFDLERVTRLHRGPGVFGIDDHPALFGNVLADEMPMSLAASSSKPATVAPRRSGRAIMATI